MTELFGCRCSVEIKLCVCVLESFVKLIEIAYNKGQTH